MNELVSIIMPSYNTEKFIEESIQSVLDQTYENWELIIIDDCSSDNTDEVVKKYQNDNRIIYLKNKNNEGAALSRNKGISLAAGKWIAFLDSDDLWDKTKLEEQINFMKINHYSFSYTNYREISESNEILNQLITGPKHINKRKMFQYCWPGCLTVMYDANKVGLIQVEDLKKNNDYAMWLKVIRKTNCFLLDETLASYRKRKGSISNHSYVKLIKHHYFLFRYGEQKNVISAFFYTLQNLVFGVMKRIKYK